MHQIVFGILTVSDTCFRNEKEDTAGPRLQTEVKKKFPSCSYCHKTVPDDLDEIKNTLIQWTKLEYNVILTVGGTGFSPRDVTPEATRAVIEKEAPGIAYAMISKSLVITDMAMLSRAVCGIRSQTLIINLPGSEKAALECFKFICGAIHHAVALLTDNKDVIQTLHDELTASVNRHKSSLLPPNQTGYDKVTKQSKVKINEVANRNRKSPYPMLEVEDAVSKILMEIVPSMEREQISFDKTLNRILAQDIYAPEPIPPFRCSIKDGYAVKVYENPNVPQTAVFPLTSNPRNFSFHTTTGGALMKIPNVPQSHVSHLAPDIRNVRGVTVAGDAPNTIPLGTEEVIRISTGAAIPPGANAVVQVEDTSLIEKSEDGTLEAKIEILSKPTIGQDIREIGSDVQKGELVLRKGERITAAHIGIFAMLGITQVTVVKRASIGIISTGNELKAPDEPLEPGQIRDGNKFVLMNLLKRYSYESNDCGTAKDNPDSVMCTLEMALTNNDVIITTGGVSMGEHDIVKQVLEQDFDAMIHFGRVNMKPGKPTTFATLIYNGRTKIVFALPGNPVSCCVTSLLFVIPTLRYLERNKDWRFLVIKASFPEAKNTDERPEYHRVKVVSDKENMIVTSTGNQVSSRLNSLVGANGLAIVPKTNPNIPLDTVDVIIFDDILYKQKRLVTNAL